MDYSIQTSKRTRLAGVPQGWDSFLLQAEAMEDSIQAIQGSHAAVTEQIEARMQRAKALSHRLFAWKLCY